MKVLRQVAGETKGMKPSMTSTNAMASQKVVLSSPDSILIFCCV